MVVCLKPPFSNEAMVDHQWWQAVTLQCVFLSAIFERLQWYHDLENSPDFMRTMIGQEALHYSEYVNTQSLSLRKGLIFKLQHINIVLFTPTIRSWKMENLYRHAVEKILYLETVFFFFVWENKNWLYIQNCVYNILQLEKQLTNFSFNQCHKQEFSLFLRRVVFKKQQKTVFLCLQAVW